MIGLLLTWRWSPGRLERRCQKRQLHEQTTYVGRLQLYNTSVTIPPPIVAVECPSPSVIILVVELNRTPASLITVESIHETPYVAVCHVMAGPGWLGDLIVDLASPVLAGGRGRVWACPS